MHDYAPSVAPLDWSDPDPQAHGPERGSGSHHYRLEAIPDPPCVRCSLRLVCRAHRLACEAFAGYVKDGTASDPARPTRETYARLFGGGSPPP